MIAGKLLEFDQTWTMVHDLWKITYIQDGDRGGGLTSRFMVAGHDLNSV